MIITLLRIIMTGIRNFVRNSWLTIAATAVMVVALTIVLIAVVLNVTAKNAIDVLSENLQISVYLLDEAPEDRIASLQSGLEQNEFVADVDFVDQQEAQQRFSATFGDDEGIVEGLAIIGGDSLPASLEISANDLEQVESIADVARDDDFADIVESVSLGRVEAQDTIARATAARSFILRASIISAAVFGAVSVLIIFNTIRMTTFTRSDEIRIMKLVGATPRFIRGPFLVEASMYGVIAGLISVGAVYAIIVFLGGKVSTQPEFNETYNFFLENRTMAGMMGGAIASGVFVGVVSSALAMKRYLRLKNW